MEGLLWLLLDLLGVTKRHRDWDLVVLLAGSAITFALPRLRAWMRRRRSADWPMVHGTVQSGKATVTDRWFAPKVAAELVYVYSVSGLRYSGVYKRRVKDQRVAKQEADRLRGRSLVVRYNPAKAGVSLVVEEDNPGLDVALA